MSECKHLPHKAAAHFHGHVCAHCGAVVVRGIDEIPLNRKIMADLLRGVPDAEIVWRTEETYTAKQMIEQIEAGTETGRQYASDILKIARDLLRRKSAKP